MDKLLPCPFCGSAAKICEDEEGYFCVACMGECFSCTEPHGEPEHAADTWNRRAPDPALLALGRLGAKLFDRAWIKSVGFVNEGGLQDDLDRDTVAFGLVRYEAPGDFQMAPGIADAIAALLAPDGADGAGEVTP